MIEVAFHPLETVKNGLRYAVIAAGGGRLALPSPPAETWELPGGHREPGDIRRRPAVSLGGNRRVGHGTDAVCLYSVFGRMGGADSPELRYAFYARVTWGASPESGEIAEVRALPAAAGKLRCRIPIRRFSRCCGNAFSALEQAERVKKRRKERGSACSSRRFVLVCG